MRAFITDANIAHPAVSLSRSVVARTKLGQLHSPGGIAEAALAQRGTVPDAYLVIAVVRRWACVVNDQELQHLCDLLDGMLEKEKK